MRAKPPEILALESLRHDSTLTGPEREAFDLLAASDDLTVRARREWDGHADDRARRDAVMGQIKMRTALAILQGERAKARVTQLDFEQAEADREAAHVDAELAAVEDEVGIAEQLRTVAARTADERLALTQQIDAAKREAATDHQNLVEQLNDEKRHTEAVDTIRLAELEIEMADSVDGAHYAETRYAAATALLDDARKLLAAAKWDDAVVRATSARAQATACVQAAKPSYDKADRIRNDRARDRALEAAAAALPRIDMRLERADQVQRLVLVLPRLFESRQAALLPDDAKLLDGVKNLLVAFPSYQLHVVGLGETDDAAPRSDQERLPLARANALYWALVSRGVDPRRMSVNDARMVRTAAAPGDRSDAGLHAADVDSRLEIALRSSIAAP